MVWCAHSLLEEEPLYGVWAVRTVGCVDGPSAQDLARLTTGIGISAVRRASDDGLVERADRATLVDDDAISVSSSGQEVLRLKVESVIGLRHAGLGGGLTGSDILVTDDLEPAPEDELTQSRADEPPEQGQAG